MNTAFIFKAFDRIRFNASLYDSITEGWKHIFGDNFHFGYFSSPDVSLESATDALINQMASLGDFSDMSRVLDVGCGIGNPAFYLHQKFGCSVTGISTSEEGVQQAEEASRKRGFQEKVRFLVRNGLDNGFKNDSFDIIWVMESSHLMKDKKRLFLECWRVLKPGGVILLCDIMTRRPSTFLDRLEYLQRMKLRYFTSSLSFIKTFGITHVEAFDAYQRIARDCGFEEVTFIDISEKALPTFECWKKNIEANRERVLETFTPNQINDFIMATDLGKDTFERKIGGYGILKASKPRA